MHGDGEGDVEVVTGPVLFMDGEAGVAVLQHVVIVAWGIDIGQDQYGNSAEEDVRMLYLKVRLVTEDVVLVIVRSRIQVGAFVLDVVQGVHKCVI